MSAIFMLYYVVNRVKAEFKNNFGFELEDTDLKFCPDRIEISYRDYNLSNEEKYNRTKLVERYKKEADYIEVHGVVRYDEIIAGKIFGEPVS